MLNHPSKCHDSYIMCTVRHQMACGSVGLPLYHVLSVVSCPFVIASYELICVKCEQILPKQLILNMKTINLTNAIFLNHPLKFNIMTAIFLNHPLNFNSMTALRQWLLDDNPLISTLPVSTKRLPQWTCYPSIQLALENVAIH